MKKPQSLRNALTSTVIHLRENPECLHLFVDEGAVISTLAPSLSWEYRYTLNVIVTDYAGDPNLLMAPILSWLRDNQPDIMANPENREKGFTFEVDILNHTACDISINLKLTERIQVRADNGHQVVEALPEPGEPDDYWIDRRG
ncbi:phage tail protein [Dickeya oryzae]|uniref:phage tail protein n=1 Tax=Dickeya oryzae TaxID=1240404 RepID=UPI001AEC8626|nr:phage tail protein [Dickeya oryzae]MBP2850529.1 phage tail protein [Dickeya oryzae]